MSSDAVLLDVGGTVYRTTRSTLTRYPDSMLAKLLDGGWSDSNRPDIFIDRNGRPFEFVLDYLRNAESTVLPKDETLLCQIKFEAVYYNLPGLVKLCEAKEVALQEQSEKIAQRWQRRVGGVEVVGQNVRWVQSVADTLLNSSLCEFYGKGLSTDFSVTCLDCDKNVALFHVLDGGFIEDINRTYPSFVASQKTEKALRLISDWNGVVTRQRQDGCLQVDWEDSRKSFHVPQSAILVLDS